MTYFFFKRVKIYNESNQTYLNRISTIKAEALVKKYLGK